MIFSKLRSFETGPASPRTTAIGLAFAASVLLVLAIVVSRISYGLHTTGQRTQAEIIDFVDRGDGMQSAVFQFTDMQGQTHIVTSGSKSTHPRNTVGDKVRIVYDAGDPSDARKDSVMSLYFGPVVLAIMSLLFYGGAALVWRFRSYFQKDYEARRGRTIVTTVNSDGSVTQTVHSSAPVFRWTGFFLAGLGIAAWLGALAMTFQHFTAGGTSLTIGFLIFLVVIGGLLLLGAFASLRHAKFMQELD